MDKKDSVEKSQAAAKRRRIEAAAEEVEAATEDVEAAEDKGKEAAPSMGTAASLVSGVVSSASTAAAGAAETTMLAVRSCKMVLCVRTDLAMGKGKMCAQSAHAAIAAYQQAMNGTARQKKCLQVWDKLGSTKIALKVSSESELLELHSRALEAGITSAYIQDAGHTQVDPGTITVLAIGPEEVSIVDSLTGHLKLL